MSQMTDFFMIMGAIVCFLFMVMGIIDWLSRGFWKTWLSARMSRGKKWLVRVWTSTGTYYMTGKPEGQILKYKDRQKNSRTLRIIDGSAYKSFGVDCVEVDETTNGVRLADIVNNKPPDAVRTKGAFHVIPGFDAITFDSLLQRAYELGKSAKQNKEKLILIVVVVTALLVILLLFLTYQMSTRLDLIVDAVSKGGGPVI